MLELVNPIELGEILEDIQKETLADRVKQRMEKLGLSEDDVVKRMGRVISQAAFHKIKSGQTKKPRHILEISEALECSSTWLSTGKGHAVTAGTVEMTVNEPLSMYSMDELGKDRIAVKPLIPLISFVQAGQFCECIDLMEPGDAEDWLPLPKGASPSTYALRVKGSSMTNPLPNGHNYPEGIIIFVDPEQEVLPGHRGIFKTPDTNEATFKELVSDNGKLYLRPLNPQFSMVEVDKNMTTCGRVIGSYLPE